MSIYFHAFNFRGFVQPRKLIDIENFRIYGTMVLSRQLILHIYCKYFDASIEPDLSI